MKRAQTKKATTWAASALAVLACLGAPEGAGAQQQRAAAKLEAIKVMGSKKYAEETVIAASGLTVGQEVGVQDLQTAADRLSQLGPFQNVQFRFVSKQDKVEVTFDVIEAAALPVWFDNFAGISDEELTKAIQERVALFDGTAPEQGTMLDTMTEALEWRLAARGMRGHVEHQVITPPSGEGRVLLFQVAGATLKMNGVHFNDPLAGDNPRLKEHARELVGKPYSRLQVELFAYEHARPVYLEAGHLRATFGAPRLMFTGDPKLPLADNALVVVPVEAGKVYRWGGATWRGNAALPASVLDSYVELPAGEPANGMKLLGAWEKVRTEYGRRGYLDVKLDPVPQFDEANARVTYSVGITEGPQYRMGQLILTGLSVAAERKLAAAWKIAPGQIFDRVYFDDFMARGIRPAFGDSVVNYNEVGQWLRQDAEKRIVDVLLDFH